MNVIDLLDKEFIKIKNSFHIFTSSEKGSGKLDKDIELFVEKVNVFHYQALNLCLIAYQDPIQRSSLKERNEINYKELIKFSDVILSYPMTKRKIENFNFLLEAIEDYKNISNECILDILNVEKK